MKIYKTKRGDEVFLDDEDYFNLIVKKDYTYYAVKNRKRTIMNVRRMIPAKLSDTGRPKSQFIHWDIIGHPGEMDTDHKDGNPLNNQKNNLRIISRRGNMGNLRHENTKKKFSSKYTGVTLHKHTGKWQASIMINNKSKYLGLFLNEEDAAQAYQNAYKML